MALDQATLAVFGPPPAGIDLADSQVAGNNAAVITLLCLALIAVILRFIARITLRNPLKTDDWAIIVALVFIGATGGLSITGGGFNAGKHVWAVRLHDVTQIFKILYVYTFIYATACASTKISILFFYRRVFSYPELSLRLSILFGFFLTLSYPIIIWVTMACCCQPLSFYWNQFSGAKGQCIDVNSFFLALGIINMLNDVVVLLIPFPRILKLQMKKRQKAAICGVMTLGSFVCVASIVRIYYLSEFTKAEDITWEMGPVFIWSTIEPSFAIVCACLPHLAPLARLVRINISSSFHSKKSSTGYPSRPWRSTSGAGQGSQNSCGTKLDFGRDRIQRQEADDQIGLTNYVTAGAGLRKPRSIESTSEDDNIYNQSIVLQSSFVQLSGSK